MLYVVEALCLYSRTHLFTQLRAGNWFMIQTGFSPFSLLHWINYQKIPRGRKLITICQHKSESAVCAFWHIYIMYFYFSLSESHLTADWHELMTPRLEPPACRLEQQSCDREGWCSRAGWENVGGKKYRRNARWDEQLLPGKLPGVNVTWEVCCSE